MPFLEMIYRHFLLLVLFSEHKRHEICCIYKPNPLFALIKHSWAFNTAQAWDLGLFPLGVVKLKTLANRDKRGHQSWIAIKVDLVGNKNRREESCLRALFQPRWSKVSGPVTHSLSGSPGLMAWKIEEQGESCARRRVHPWVPKNLCTEEDFAGKGGRLGVERLGTAGLGTAGDADYH